MLPSLQASWYKNNISLKFVVLDYHASSPSPLVVPNGAVEKIFLST